VTILDMLDQLEAQIATLRARAEGQPALLKKKKTSSKKARKKPIVEASEPVANGAAAEQAPSLVGKRQALGRSLLQLRKAHGDTPGPH
jgi:hypothetical protein